MNILLVEDTVEAAESLKASLKREGFVVDTAADGADGLSKALAVAYDLILLDIGLPLKDGRQVCRELRAFGRDTPIIMLTASGEIETKVELFQLGADDYVTKPFSFEELSARIGALLRRPHRLESAILAAGELCIDIDSRTVRCGKKRVSLTLKEFALLEYLMRNRGRVLSRMELLEHVWDVNADPFTNTVETHIMNIRKKIGGRRGKEIIRTVSGAGYKLE